MKIQIIKASDDPETAMRQTLALIGRAIKQGSRDLKIRNYAARLASTARPKDYFGQVKAIYDSFVKTWRYVKDPLDRELLSFSPDVLYRLVIGADGKGAGAGYGVGDCDCASAAIGSLLQSIGFPVRLATTADPRAPMGGTFGHVFAQALIPRMGWITVDPVLHPLQGLGAVAPHSRLAIWTLDGELIAAKGNYKKKREVRRWRCMVSEKIDLLGIIFSPIRLTKACLAR